MYKQFCREQERSDLSASSSADGVRVDEFCFF
jgi:hypothetical protein